MRRFAALGVTVLALVASLAVLLPSTSLAAGAPAVATGASSAPTDSTATIAGTVNPNSELTSYGFQYGTTTNYGQQTSLTSAGSGGADVAVTADLTALTPGTTYHYRTFATNPSGSTFGADQTFKTTGTAPPAPPTPSATTGTATATANSATVNGSVTPNSLATSYYFEFGATTNYGQQTPPQSAGSGSGAVAVSAGLSGLVASTAYHYRLVAVGPGNAFSFGADHTLTTTATTLPVSLGLFGQDAFSDQHGVAGVFVACIGGSACAGSMNLSRSGKALGSRAKFTLKPNSGGFVHITVNDLGKRLLRSRGVMNVRSTVQSTVSGSKPITKTIKFIRYSTKGFKG